MSQIFILRLVWVVWPSSVTDNLRGRYHHISSCRCCKRVTCHSLRWYNTSLLKLSVTEDGLRTETGLTVKNLLCNWHIIYPPSNP